MTPPLDGVRVAVAECRQIDELTAMLRKEGATPLSYPLLGIFDQPDAGPVEAWVRDAVAGRFAWVVWLTGEGVRRLTAVADRLNLRAEWLAALATASSLTRGPKPVKALKELGLAPTAVADRPTTEGVISALRDVPLSGATVGVQHYSADNPPLMAFLESAGAEAVPVRPYVYAPDSDSEKVVELIRKMAGGEVEAMVFTSSPQADRLFEVAAERGVEAELRAGLGRVAVAAVGPIAADSLRRLAVEVAILPQQGFVMKNLVQHVKRHFAG